MVLIEENNFLYWGWEIHSGYMVNLFLTVLFGKLNHVMTPMLEVHFGVGRLNAEEKELSVI